MRSASSAPTCTCASTSTSRNWHRWATKACAAPAARSARCATARWTRAASTAPCCISSRPSSAARTPTCSTTARCTPPIRTRVRWTSGSTRPSSKATGPWGSTSASARWTGQCRRRARPMAGSMSRRCAWSWAALPCRRPGAALRGCPGKLALTQAAAGSPGASSFAGASAFGTSVKSCSIIWAKRCCPGCTRSTWASTPCASSISSAL